MTTVPARATRFGSLRTAFTWAHHVARAGRVRTRVVKRDGQWFAWRYDGPARPW